MGWTNPSYGKWLGNQMFNPGGFVSLWDILHSEACLAEHCCWLELLKLCGMKKTFKNKAIFFVVLLVSFQRQKLEIKWMNLASYFANLIEINFKRPCWGLIVCVWHCHCHCYEKQLQLQKTIVIVKVGICDLLWDSPKKWRNTQWIYNIVYMLCTYMWLIFMVN